MFLGLLPGGALAAPVLNPARQRTIGPRASQNTTLRSGPESFFSQFTEDAEPRLAFADVNGDSRVDIVIPEIVLKDLATRIRIP